MEIAPVKPFQVLASSNITHGEIAGATSATQLPDIAVPTYALIKAQPSNAGVVYIGSVSGTTVAGGTTDTTSGYPLSAGQEMAVYIKNLNLLYRICDNTGDDISYIIY